MVSVWERADGELGAEGATGLVYLMESWGGGKSIAFLYSLLITIYRKMRKQLGQKFIIRI